MNKTNSFREDLLKNGWVITSSSPSGTTYSRPVPDDVARAMEIASASSSYSLLERIKKAFCKLLRHITVK